MYQSKIYVWDLIKMEWYISKIDSPLGMDVRMFNIYSPPKCGVIMDQFKTVNKNDLVNGYVRMEKEEKSVPNGVARIICSMVSKEYFHLVWGRKTSGKTHYRISLTSILSACELI